ncbi:3-hydroxyacyl-CoA dehydrogenase family protein [Jeotgalibacillus proteolyticus]|uniref:L-gulonate 3-dehydrogenase n=1 Tax=Jeotgalibacillus proteolyticus TaxID=2082395 RepID=A0A2S5GD89_9BACL|nr:3-hydroxyacyl-CoA dehydrogenase family protein [Jeotgalibacillus proteolyticus]PPA70863.1 3-hydroxybutyryl-CoA dehydrogenase [Jeotgalibacillus proteolyticus]
MENLSVIGCGTMGHSIALAAAWSGHFVKVFGLSDDEVGGAVKGIENKLSVMVDNQLFSKEEASRISSAIHFTTSLTETAKDATFMIECIPENLLLKQELYHQLERIVPEDTIIASNTSGLLPSDLSESMKFPNRFIVTHFWNPGHLIPLVEVVKGANTDEKTLERTMVLLKEINKRPVLVQKEIPGFIGNRLQYALFREAQALLDEGVATKEDIDAAVTYSIGRRLPVTGPLMTADMGGLDIFSAISDYLFRELSDVKESGETLRSLVEDKKLGDKSGEGFYKWDESFSKEMNAEREQTLIHFLKMDVKSQKEQ